MKTKIFTAAIIALLLLLDVNVFAAEYEVRDLGVWDPVDINNNGQIVGSIYSKAAFWQDGILETICNDLNSNAVSINDNGQVAIDVPDGSISRGYFWEDGILTLLNSPWRQPFLYVFGIDDNGRIFCGDWESVGSWLNGSFSTIQTGYLYDGYWGVAANNLGDVLGWGQNVGICLWGENLPSCPIPPYTRMKINDNKQIIGGKYICESNSYILFDSFDVKDNNNFNVVVGSSNGHAAIYENGILKNLNEFIPQNSGWILDSANAINDIGQIVCYGSLYGANKVCLLTPISTYELSDSGTEFPVDYETYGIFSDQSTSTYNYELNNPVGLATAVGEGIYPNTESVLLDPRYQEYLSSGRLDGNIWDFVNSDDPWADFFKWATAVNVQLGEKLFYTALALENAGQFQHAIKAYKALIVHFPYTQAYNPYENIYWYPAIAAIDAIARLTRDNPEIGYEQINAKITVENGYNSNRNDDIFTANPGGFTEYTLQDRIDRSSERINASDFDVRGTGRVQVIKRSDNSWQLRVDDKPFKVQGITYSPTQVGMIADDQTAWQWLDTNDNGLIDAAEEAWVDKNRNNLQDADEPAIGDFQLLKDMGCNTIRIFHYAGADNKTYQPAEYNKPLLRQLYNQYGIMVMMADFFGGYTIGSGASWENGTDYTNPEHRDAIKEVVRQMVLDHKDESYVLMWLLGNENNMASEYNGINATRTNAATEPQAYAEFLNEVAQMIHEIDPNHPVAVGNLNLGLVEYFEQYAPELDIIATNHYADRNGVGVSYLREAQEKINRPIIIAEYGADAYHQEQGVNELEQKTHHFGGWKAISYNGSTTPGEGNLLGGVIFEWTDEWWKAQSEYDSPFIQQIAPQFYWGIMPDHFAHEEWFGICSQGDGTQSPFLRQTRSTYDLYKQMWTPSAVFDEETGFVTLSWDGYPGLTYTVEFSEDNQTWTDADTDIKASDDFGRTIWIDNGSQTGSVVNALRYYRVRINNALQPTYVLETSSGTNHIPIVTDQEVFLNGGGDADFSLNAWDQDGDALTYRIVNEPQYGVLSGTGIDLVYTQNPGFLGEDWFSYVVSDGKVESAVGYVRFSIIGNPNAIAYFVGKDTMTQGNWIGTYGGEGYNIIGDSIDYPNYADVNITAKKWQWSGATSDISALEKVSGSDRIAACYYGTGSFDINININKLEERIVKVGIYCLDWDSTNRRQTVQVLDANSGEVLDEQDLNTAFNDGVYLVWGILGNVIIRVNQTGADNAVVSGIFFGEGGNFGVAPSITAQPEDLIVTEGQSATFNVAASGSDPLSYQWYKDDVLIEGATEASYSIAITDLSDDAAVFKVNINNDYGTAESSKAVLTVNKLSFVEVQFIKKDTITQGNWSGTYGEDGYNIIGNTVNYPAYAQVNTSGNRQWPWKSSTTQTRALEKAVGTDRIAACWYSSGSFDIDVEITDGQTHQVGIYCLDWDSTNRRQTVQVLDANSGEVLDEQDLNTAFNDGVYLVWGILGNVIIRVNQTGADNAVVSGIFFDSKGVVIGVAPSITVQPQDVTAIEGQAAIFSATASGSDPMTYQWYRDDAIIDGATESSYTISSVVLSDDNASFKVAITNNYGTITSNPASLIVNSIVNTAAVFINKDTITQGNWSGTYGEDGYNIIGNTVNYPAYAQVNTSGNRQWPWKSSTTQTRALEKAVGTDRIAACWYSSGSFDMNVEITDGQTHQVGIYCLDWDSTNRRQTVQVLDANSGEVLDEQYLNTAFNDGVYLVWNISGSVIIRVTQTSSDNAVISGIFFDDQFKTLDLVRKEADHILSCQYLNPGQPGHGSINDVPGAPTWIVPREMGLAILGLVRASELLHDPLYLERANLAADYLVRTQDISANNFEVFYPGSRMFDGSWFNQYGYETAGDINNTNYPYIIEKLSKSPTQTAEVMMAFYALGYANADSARKESMRQAAENLISLQGSDGLVKGGQEIYETYPGSEVYQYRVSDWRWNSDNSFAYQALRAAEAWAVEQSDTINAQRFHDAADSVLDGINTKLYVSDTADPDHGVWWGVIDANDVPQFPQGHEWMSYAPQMLDVPANGVGQQIVGDWIHNTLQIKTEGGDFGAVVWNDTWGSERKSPGFSFQAMLAWLDLGQSEYARNAREWVFNSGLLHADLGWIDWIESETSQAEDWARFIDTAFYCLTACTGGYDFNIPATYIGN